MSYDVTELGRIGTGGGDILAIVDVSPDAATGDITFSNAAYAYPLAVIPLIEDPAANAQVAVQALKDGTTHNKINLKLWQATNSAAATNFKDFRLLVLLKDVVV
ncbi:hypothetical protein LCGC14_2268810 [marine sediment metagenome]|uniref:Uncharacterized protein n=1 Tax=marine sediment metagenome TaxID=412755 RepID=A0A0F9DJS3_9ZZZZ